MVLYYHFTEDFFTRNEDAIFLLEMRILVITCQKYKTNEQNNKITCICETYIRAMLLQSDLNK